MTLVSSNTTTVEKRNLGEPAEQIQKNQGTMGPTVLSKNPANGWVTHWFKATSDKARRNNKDVSQEKTTDNPKRHSRQPSTRSYSVSLKLATRRILAMVLVLLYGNHTNILLTLTAVESFVDMSNTQRFTKHADGNAQVPQELSPCLREAISRTVNSTSSPRTMIDRIGSTETNYLQLGQGVTPSLEKCHEGNMTVHGSAFIRKVVQALANQLGITIEEAYATLVEMDPEVTKWSTETQGIA